MEFASTFRTTALKKKWPSDSILKLVYFSVYLNMQVQGCQSLQAVRGHFQEVALYHPLVAYMF